jgi:hypothetical protein|uniref:Uncharacterized protein n=1 Tax=Oryza sativa subsp. japonica TaxID=39947 RepID=Q6H5J1_ORYSJ|nr:hypothetical protein [Oryza sativa Japonica Group]
MKNLGGKKRREIEEEAVGEDAGGDEQAEAEHIGARAFIEDAAQERWGREGRRGDRRKKTGL